jgi:hypothetical protein
MAQNKEQSLPRRRFIQEHFSSILLAQQVHWYWSDYTLAGKRMVAMAVVRS